MRAVTIADKPEQVATLRYAPSIAAIPSSKAAVDGVPARPRRRHAAARVADHRRVADGAAGCPMVAGVVAAKQSPAICVARAASPVQRKFELLQILNWTDIDIATR